MELWELIARERIRQTIADYTWCGDFADAEGFASQFTTDGVLDIKGRTPIVGRDEVREAVVNMFWLPADVVAHRRAAAPFRHHVSSVRIEVDDPKTARAWAYFLVVGKLGADHWGRYSDEVRRDGERWLFARRRVSVDGASAGSTFQGEASA